MPTFSDSDIRPIGIVRSPFREKFAIPRQPGLVDVPGIIELLPPYDRAEAVRGLDAYSHLWVIFHLHAITAESTSLTVRPPRLGGNARVGVFATRATYRPNRIGLSAVRLVGVNATDAGVQLEIRGHDLLNGTPVLDIKPYVAYTDAIPDAVCGFADEAPPTRLEVVWSDAALAQCAAASAASGLDFHALITALLCTDPRPAYRGGSEDGRRYGFRLDRYDVRAVITGHMAQVVEIAVASSGSAD